MAKHDTNPEFDLEQFLPYSLNRAAEATSRSYQPVYVDLYGMIRTQWRVMTNLGKFGAMTARDISHIEKSKVSRAVSTLETAGLLLRTPSNDDRRAEFLSLTEKGITVFRDLGHRANEFENKLRADLGEQISAELVHLLGMLMKR